MRSRRPVTSGFPLWLPKSKRKNKLVLHSRHFHDMSGVVYELLGVRVGAIGQERALI